MTEPRSPEDRLRGVLRVTVGSVEKVVPTLPLRAALDWWETNAVAMSRELPEHEAVTEFEFIADYNRLGTEVALDLVLAYDRTAALGGREWLEENADPTQINAALQLMMANVFPFATDTSVILAALVGRIAVASSSQNSTNGHSPTGASTRPRSKRASTRRS